MAMERAFLIATGLVFLALLVILIIGHIPQP